MPGLKPDQSLLPTLLDRLLDDTGSQPGRKYGQSSSELRQAVRRDLEALLNTPQRCRSWPPELTELDRSLISYGVPDVTSVPVASELQREAFRRMIEDVVARSEPRFKRISVKLLDNPPGLERMLRFRIDALIYAEPAPETVVFDSLLDPATRSFSVRSMGDA